MGPLFGMPMYDSENPPPPRRRALKSLVVGMVAALAIMLLFMMTRKIGPGPSESVVGISVVVILVLLVTFSAAINGALRRTNPEKRKRGLEGLDMYSLIDRMVDDLDEDELDYLRGRLEEREHGPKHELAESLDELLVQRQEDHEAGRR
jgi:hypothetical protein